MKSLYYSIIGKTMAVKSSKMVILAYVLLTFFLNSCKKYVEADPPITGLVGSAVYTTDATAISVLTGIYAGLGTGGLATGNKSISLYAGLSADELVPYSGVANTDAKMYYYRNALFANSTATTPGTEFWATLYNYIFICNSAIEGLEKSITLTEKVKKQLLGEAKFMRAFFYFYLVNLYGDVPLVKSTDYTINSTLSKSSKEVVYQEIVSDLVEAKALLNSKFLQSDLITQYAAGMEERIRPTRWAAIALLSRVYLYNNDYVNAEIEANAVLENSALFTLTSLDRAFLKNSNEAIWQLQPVITGHNTEDAWVFILPPNGPNSARPVFINKSLLDSFEPNDLRALNGNWIKSVTVNTKTYHYPYKYKRATPNAEVTEYLTVLRLAEQRLIRSEARAHLNKLDGAIEDVNAIRKRAGLADTSASDKPKVLSIIMHERQVELFTEWGHRWLDLKRTGTVNDVMTVQSQLKGGVWDSNWALYPIWLYDIQNNINLVQNAGY